MRAMGKVKNKVVKPKKRVGRSEVFSEFMPFSPRV